MRFEPSLMSSISATGLAMHESDQFILNPHCKECLVVICIILYYNQKKSNCGFNADGDQ